MEDPTHGDGGGQVKTKVYHAPSGYMPLRSIHLPGKHGQTHKQLQHQVMQDTCHNTCILSAMQILYDFKGLLAN